MLAVLGALQRPRARAKQAMSAKEYCDICKRYHEPGLCPAERVMALTGSTAFAVQILERDRRIDEAVRWITTDSLGTPEERANMAVRILRGESSSDGAIK